MRGESVRATSNLWPGVWIHLLDDVYYGLFHRAVEHARLRAYLETYRRPKTYAVWSARDPKPFVIQAYHALRQAAAAARDRDARTELRSHVQSMPAGAGFLER